MREGRRDPAATANCVIWGSSGGICDTPCHSLTRHARVAFRVELKPLPANSDEAPKLEYEPRPIQPLPCRWLMIA